MRLAVVATVYRPDSHADVLLARWFEALPGDRDWGWPGPKSSIVSAYVAQMPKSDLSRQRFQENSVSMFPSIAEALRCGGSTLAVDGVLLIAEHGDYPYNKLNQQLYPRAEMFSEIADVFAADGRAVPVFVDKHLSWDFDRAKCMLERAEALGFEVLSSSSIPFCRHDPLFDIDGDRVDEALAIFPLVDSGRFESYGYHSLEFVQHTLERRCGGASGVERVTAWRDDTVWAAAESRELPRQLFERVYAHAFPELPSASSIAGQQIATSSYAFRIEYGDGLKVTHIGLADHGAFAFGVHRHGRVDVTVARAGAGQLGRFANFAILARVVEDWLGGGAPPFPKTRALLACGTLQAMAQAVSLPPGTPQPTPHLSGLSYPPSSQRTGIDYL
ncbi:MAG: hypothetical protein AAF823_02965 [Planctomycetota bacterium]